MNKEKLNARLEEIEEQSHIKNVNIINEEYKDGITLDEDIVDDRILKMISSHGLMRENKILKEKLSDAKWWLVRILNNDENASDFQKYMREEFGEVI